MGFLRDTFGLAKRDEEIAYRDVEPLEGTSISLWNTIIPSWWSENIDGTALIGNAALARRVWVANRCIQMNAQQIASMPLEFAGAEEPAWVSSPDPVGFPNGIGDALQAAVECIYGYGFVLLYVTEFYASGLPRNWTVLDSGRVNVQFEKGRRSYKIGEHALDARRVVQIDRDPSPSRAHGTSALQAYAQVAFGMLAAGNQSLTQSQGGIPKFYLKSARVLKKAQAEAIQLQWAEATQSRNGMPPIVDPELEPKEMSFDPADLALLDTQEFSAKAIATAFGVPAVLLNMSLVGGLTYQNPAALGEMWWRFELRPTATRIANALTAQMLPRGQWVSFDAADTFALIDAASDDDDVQLSQVAKASPAQQPQLTAIGGTGR
jgi:Phage portal protein